MTAQVAVNILWAVWYATWIGAVIWSGKTTTQMKTDMGGLHRFLSGLGAVLLFLPSEPHNGPRSISNMLTGRLWDSWDRVDWGLFLLTVVAFGFCWWARLHLGRLWSGFVTLKEDHRIVDTGPYALVRHPIYSGVIFAVLTTALMRANPAALVGCSLIAIGFSMTARVEERFLREQLGADAYDNYSRRVGMLIPRIA
jgi:protein-S-isoprenylcysteine O-methyltransferase Ste14